MQFSAQHWDYVDNKQPLPGLAVTEMTIPVFCFLLSPSPSYLNLKNFFPAQPVLHLSSKWQEVAQQQIWALDATSHWDPRKHVSALELYWRWERAREKVWQPECDRISLIRFWKFKLLVDLKPLVTSFLLWALDYRKIELTELYIRIPIFLFFWSEENLREK